jgi:putative ABC transport system permease protein
MIKHYLIAAWRNLLRNKTFSAINLLGMALGLTCSLLIMLWIWDEQQIDNFHANIHQLYQVYEQQHHDGVVDAGYQTQGLLATEIKRVIPQVQATCGVEKYPPMTFAAGNKVVKLEGNYAGASFFSMFSYPLLEGSANTVIARPGTIAISHKMANLFYGSPTNAMGKTIRYDNQEDLLITGVFEDVTTRSTLQFDYVRNWEDFTKPNAWTQSWGSADPKTFVQLQAGTDVKQVSAQLKEFIYRYQIKNDDNFTTLALQPFGEKYLHGIFKNGVPDGGRIEYVHLFSILAIFILLIACINFMNLATARSTQRAKEVGIRKVIGAVRSRLIGQFFGEALLITGMAFVLATALVFLLLPGFNQLTEKQLVLPLKQPLAWCAMGLLLLITGVIAGSYPALFLSSLSPIQTLKGQFRTGKNGAMFRKGLVVFQFALSMLLIIATIVIYRQMDYVRHKNLGYDKENLVYIPLEGEALKHYQAFSEEALRQPGVLGVSRIRETPTVIGHHKGDVGWPNKSPELAVSFADAVVDYNFVSTMHLQLKAGRDFSRDYPSDARGYLLNEAAVKVMGTKDPVGGLVAIGNQVGPVIGVLKDFHFNSMHEAIEPLIIRLDSNMRWCSMLVRVAPGKTTAAVASLEKLSKKVNPGYTFSYQFSDDEYNKLYKGEQTISILTTYFALLAILISCLGLFGLATFAAAQRTKEIGLRKTLGASISNIVWLLVSNFLQPVGIAMLIAGPLAWYVMQHWLQEFAYKINLDWWVFALAGSLTVVIALLTVSLQTVRAAAMNPVKSLKTE